MPFEKNERVNWCVKLVTFTLYSSPQTGNRHHKQKTLEKRKTCLWSWKREFSLRLPVEIRYLTINLIFQCGTKGLLLIGLSFIDRRLGWDPKQGESHLDAMLRGELLNALAAFGHDETINEAIRRFHIFLDDRNTAVLPPDLRRVTTLEYIATQNSFLLYLMQILIPPLCRLFMQL